MDQQALSDLFTPGNTPPSTQGSYPLSYIFFLSLSYSVCIPVVLRNTLQRKRSGFDEFSVIRQEEEVLPFFTLRVKNNFHAGSAMSATACVNVERVRHGVPVMGPIHKSADSVGGSCHFLSSRFDLLCRAAFYEQSSS
jgi:hypothetical protein